jgi:hypothetical protein
MLVQRAMHLKAARAANDSQRLALQAERTAEVRRGQPLAARMTAEDAAVQRTIRNHVARTGWDQLTLRVDRSNGSRTQCGGSTVSGSGLTKVRCGHVVSEGQCGGWVGGWLGGWVGRWVGGWVSEWVGEWVGGWLSECAIGCMGSADTLDRTNIPLCAAAADVSVWC